METQIERNGNKWQNKELNMGCAFSIIEKKKVVAMPSKLTVTKLDVPQLTDQHPTFVKQDFK